MLLSDALAVVDGAECRHSQAEAVRSGDGYEVGQVCNGCGAALPMSWGCVECAWSASGPVVGRPGEFWFYLVATCPEHPRSVGPAPEPPL